MPVTLHAHTRVRERHRAGRARRPHATSIERVAMASRVRERVATMATGASSSGSAVKARSRAVVVRRRDALEMMMATVVVSGTCGDARARPLARARASDVVRRDGGAFEFTVRLPPGYHFTEGANSRYESSTGERGTLGGAGEATRTVTTRGGEGEDDVAVDCTVYFCREDDVCLLQRVRFEAATSEDGAARATAAYDVAAEATDATATAMSVPSFD